MAEVRNDGFLGADFHMIRDAESSREGTVQNLRAWAGSDMISAARRARARGIIHGVVLRLVEAGARQRDAEC